MVHYYKLTKSMEDANGLVEKAKQLGVAQENVNIIVKQGVDADFSKDQLLSPGGTLKDAPAGTVSAYGATFGALTTLASGVMLIAAGPVAALATGGVMAAGGIAAVLSGLGVPETEHNMFADHLEAGKVLVHVEADASDSIAKLFS